MSLLSPQTLFDGANLFVLPFWFLMVFLPNWRVTRRVMESYLPFAALALLYVYLFATSLDPETAQGFANPQLADVARLFGNERVAAAGWVHYLVLDLFVGRWIYQEGQQTGVWTIHSLVLCLFAGSMGLLSHLLSRSIARSIARPQPESSPPAEPATLNSTLPGSQS